MIDRSEYPTFQCERTPNPSCPGWVLLTFKCDICGKTNQHGGEARKTDHGHRCGHCRCYPNGYCIVG